jgi:transposase
MDMIYRCVAGLDVHKDFVTVAIRSVNNEGKVVQLVETFATMTSDLIAMRDWLADHGVSHVAMESTGVYWKPVWNILEGHFQLLLVNARHLKQVPGRKSDIRDCQWIAQLLGCGLLQASFVPERRLREFRDLTRHRANLAGEETRAANRIHKILQDANLKLSSVATDILGKSGRLILKSLIDGERDPRVLADLALGKLRKKVPELQRALEGELTDHHVFMLRQLLDHLDYLSKQILALDQRIAECAVPFLPLTVISRLQEVPGLQTRSIENIVAEIGNNMDQFPTAKHLCSWAGVCPATESSAGKRQRSKTTKGSPWLRRSLIEAAWGASRTKNSYFQAYYQRLSPRRGRKRALMAIAHSLLEVIYHLLKHPEREYRDLGPDHFDKLQPERLQRYLVKRLQGLGYEVTLKPRHNAA